MLGSKKILPDPTPTLMGVTTLKTDRSLMSLKTPQRSLLSAIPLTSQKTPEWTNGQTTTATRFFCCCYGYVSDDSPRDIVYANTSGISNEYQGMDSNSTNMD